MHMEVVDGLAAMLPGVDDGAEALRETLAGGELRCDRQHVPQQRSVLPRGVGEGWKVLTRDDKKVHRRLRCNVAESDNLLIGVQKLHGQLARGDAAKKAAHAVQDSCGVAFSEVEAEDFPIDRR